MSKDLLSLKRNRMSLAALVIMPIAFLVMFGFIFPGTNTQTHMPVGIVDLDNSAGSSAFITELNVMNKNGTMNFENFSSMQAAQTQINKGKLYGAFIIPPGFSTNLTKGQSADVIIYADNSNPQIASQIESVASGTIQD